MTIEKINELRKHIINKINANKDTDNIERLTRSTNVYSISPTC